MLRPIAALCCLLAVAAVTGCGGDGGEAGLPAFSATAAASTSATPSGAPAGAPATAASGLVDETGVTAGRIRASGAGKAAAEVWVSYWRERTRAYFEVDDSRPQLTAVATGDALVQVRRGVRQLRERKQHTIGTAVMNVGKVVVSGDTATITSCMDNRTIDVDAKLRPAEPPTPQYAFTGTATRAGGAWTISGVEITSRGVCPR